MSQAMKKRRETMDVFYETCLICNKEISGPSEKAVLSRLNQHRALVHPQKGSR